VKLPSLIIFVFSFSSILAYVSTGKSRWREILDEALRYHRGHFLSMLDEPGVDGGSREVARLLLAVLDRQFSLEMKASTGLRALLSSRRGSKSALNSMDELFMKLFRDQAFGRKGSLDPRLYRLYWTLLSTMHRWYMLRSVLFPLALFFMDVSLVLSMCGLNRSGPARMYMDIALKRNWTSQ
jgi:hypothetical protein